MHLRRKNTFFEGPKISLYWNYLWESLKNQQSTLGMIRSIVPEIHNRRYLFLFVTINRGSPCTQYCDRTSDRKNFLCEVPPNFEVSLIMELQNNFANQFWNLPLSETRFLEKLVHSPEVQSCLTPYLALCGKFLNCKHRSIRVWMRSIPAFFWDPWLNMEADANLHSLSEFMIALWVRRHPMFLTLVAICWNRFSEEISVLCKIVPSWSAILCWVIVMLESV